MTFVVTAQRTAGAVNGTMTAVAAVLKVGNAPPLLPPVSLPQFAAGLSVGDAALLLAAGATGALRRNPMVSRRRLLRGIP